MDLLGGVFGKLRLRLYLPCMSSYLYLFTNLARMNKALYAEV